MGHSLFLSFTALLSITLFFKVSTAQRVQCLQACGGTEIDRVETISGCCSNSTLGGGAFVIQGSVQCRSCNNFRMLALTAQTEITGIPASPTIGENFEIRCTIRTDEVLRASGTLQLTFPNGTVFASQAISSPETSISLPLNPLRQEDTVGDYTCTSQFVQSPEFPGVVLQQISNLNFGMVTAGPPPAISGVSIQRDSGSEPVLGEPYNLTCFTSDSVSSLAWLSPSGEELKTDDRFTVGEIVREGGVTSRTLTFNSFNEADLGEYTCQSDTSKASIIFQIQDQGLPNLNIPPPPQQPIIGRPYAPECILSNADEDVSVSIQWLNSRGEVLAMQSTTGNASLPLNFAQLSAGDAGNYMCRAVITSPLFDGPQIIQRNFNISPLAEPLSNISIIAPPEDAMIGRPYTPQCVLTNSESLQQADVMIQWIGPTGQVLNSQTTMGDVNLPLNFVSLSASDAGSYICRAVIISPLLNGSRTLEGRFILTPTPDTGEPLTEIDITTPPERPVVGKPFSPRCIVRNSPDLRQAVVMIQWIGPNGEVLNSSAVRGNASLPLNFDQLSLSDAGRYICRAMVFSPLLPEPRTIERELNLLPESDTGVNECNLGLDNCHCDATCIDLPDGFRCVCNPGFTGNGINCQPAGTEANPTVPAAICHANARLVLQGGSETCVCNQGYSGDGVNCEDIDECATGEDDCDAQASCCNTDGSFVCVCQPDFMGNEANCCRLQSDVDRTSGTRRSTKRKSTRKGRSRRSHRSRSRSRSTSESNGSQVLDEPLCPMVCEAQSEPEGTNGGTTRGTTKTTKSTKSTKSTRNTKSTTKTRSTGTPSA